MRLRAVHFACMLLLLSTLGAADAYALSGTSGSRAGQAVGVLLLQGDPANLGPSAMPLRLSFGLPAGPVAATHIHAAWTMRPPSAHCADLHAFTGFGR